MLAPLGVQADDGRVLDPEGDYTLKPEAPLWLPEPLPQTGDRAGPVGMVTEVLSRGGVLYGAGTVTDQVVAAAMARRELAPEMQLAPLRVEFAGTGEQQVMVFRGGQVTGVALGTRPAFAHARFHTCE